MTCAHRHLHRPPMTLLLQVRTDEARLLALSPRLDCQVARRPGDHAVCHRSSRASQLASQPSRPLKADGEQIPEPPLQRGTYSRRSRRETCRAPCCTCCRNLRRSSEPSPHMLSASFTRCKLRVRYPVYGCTRIGRGVRARAGGGWAGLRRGTFDQAKHDSRDSSCIPNYLFISELSRLMFDF